jgi:hypothetical protein
VAPRGEIELTVLNDETRDIASLECRWRDLSKDEADRVVAELKREAQLVRWHHHSRKRRFGVPAHDLADIEEVQGQLSF